MVDLGGHKRTRPDPSHRPKISSFSCSFWENWPNNMVGESREILDPPLCVFGGEDRVLHHYKAVTTSSESKRESEIFFSFS